MSSPAPELAVQLPSPPPPRTVFERWGRRGTAIVFGLAAVVLLLVGATIGLIFGGSTAASDPATATSTRPPDDGVDVGFLRDMTVHHEQGVLMAHIVQGEDPTADVASIAYDIEYTQTAQIGQMGGFLQLWDYSVNSLQPPMAWMTAGNSDSSAGHGMGSMGGMGGMGSGAAMTVDPSAAAQGAIMPGMATDAEIDHLKQLRGTEASIDFLQLMIRHHQGGATMMTYAADSAVNPVVRNMVAKMADAQGKEITVMTGMLAELGASPLPAPGAPASTSGSISTLNGSPDSAATGGSTTG